MPWNHQWLRRVLRHCIPGQIQCWDSLSGANTMHCSLSQWTMSLSSNICRWSRTLAHLRLLRVYWGRLHSSYFAWALRVERRCLSLASGKKVLESAMVSGLSASLFLRKRKALQRPPFESLACEAFGVVGMWKGQRYNHWSSGRWLFLFHCVCTCAFLGWSECWRPHPRCGWWF